MPFLNEHSQRFENPNKFARIRRKNNEFGEGIHAVFGITDAGETRIQAIRFDKDKFTPDEAKKWLKGHDFKTSGLESAIKKEILHKVNIVKTEAEKQLVYGVVLEPDTEDTQGDVISKEDIEETMHDYMENSRVVGLQHQIKTDSVPVESYIAPVDFNIGDSKIKKGSWVQVTKIKNSNIWAGIKKGTITGYSIGGTGERYA